ncbi:uncharacterized protein LOC103568803 [Microplitis demolitor]|uniref:uncharacterized protein LOC103568803 n=1 Tax=Microplitis demolitor TaxID=69319 RepID=UPI0006D4D18C|nr:uncharacterized protein LOC103568803 [Microplitis demolitor]XP_053595731.1 uncharacterized protein LOC103568803 [Microplitis demolitor]XP_053595732.1 uncharacterized protein LOC103568803 [Microplitis demolitor]
MVNYFIYAKDFSISTRDEKYYHENGLKTLEEFKSDVEKIKTNLLIEDKSAATNSRSVYLHWGHECVEVPENTIFYEYKRLYATGEDTLPETILEWIIKNIDINDKNNKIKLMYIITDGIMRVTRVNKCLTLTENLHFENLVFHAFNQRLDRIDLSVASSFLKGQCSIYRNYELIDDINIGEEFDYETITIDNFTDEKEKLKSYIKLKYINSRKNNETALSEINKLKRLRDRLFDNLSSKSHESKVNLNPQDKNKFLSEFVNTNWYKNLNNPSYDLKIDIEKSVSTMINYIVSDKKSYAFDALKFDKKFNVGVTEEPIVDVNFSLEQEIEFPDIILDEDKGIPVILLTELNLLDKIIFHSTEKSSEKLLASFNKFKSTMECPLFLINDVDIKESIGYFYTLNVYKQLLEKTSRTEPRTRKPFNGGIVLIDTPDFDKYNDYILSATYFNYKKINYNIGLFYYVLYKICESKQWMDKNVIDQLKKYVIRRIKMTTCKIGLSSLPLDPQEITSLPTALWYCVELSSYLFKDDPNNFMHERLRMYHGVAHHMIEILKHLNYNLDTEFINKRSDLIRHVMILKRIPTTNDKIYYLLEKIFKKKNGFLVCEIANPSNLHKLNFLKLYHKGMLNDDIIEEKIHLNDYVNLLYYDDNSKNMMDNLDIKICEKTFRPYFVIAKNKSFYTELLNVSRKVVINNDDDEEKINISYSDVDSLKFSKILSLYNLFIRCVDDFGKFPTLDEYTDYILRKKKFSKELVTIFPVYVYKGIEKVFLSYENVTKNVDVCEFIRVSRKNVERIHRIKEEGIIQFDSDNEISKFIHEEESKVFFTGRPH